MKQVLIVMSIFLCVSCNREPIDVIINKAPIIKPSSQRVIGSLIGQVVDENERPLANAVVLIEDNETLTDDSGSFSFTDIQLYEDGSYLTVTKEDYFEGSRKFYAIADQTSTISIQLTPKVAVGNFTATNGKIIEVGNATVEFPSGEYLTNDQSSYSGNITVYGNWLDPTVENTFFEMPGDMTGYDLDGQLRALSSFGLLRLELQNDNNEQLSLPDGGTAIIHLAIPQSLLAFAPDSIPLLYFSESNSNWIEDATAQLVGDSYIGSVSHLSYWNASLSLPVVAISGKISFNNEFASGTKLRIISPDNGYTAFATTSMDGSFTGKLPKDVDLEITVYHECGNKAFSQVIGPFNADATALEYNFDVDFSSTRVSGVVGTCPSYPISSNKYVRVDIGSVKYLIRANADGSYDMPLTLTDCKATQITTYGIDLDIGNISLPVHQGLSSNILVNDLLPCNNLEARGFEIDYPYMNWKDTLANQVYHTWKIHTISGTETKYIISININNNLTGNNHLTGAILFTEGSNTGTYKLEYPSQGFKVSGSCTVEEGEEMGIRSVRFSDSSDLIKITDPNKFPPGVTEEDFGAVMMNLVYYL